MFKKQWVQQVIIGVLIWVLGSAIWSLISNGFHIPALNWTSIGILAEIVFFIFIYTVAVPFASQSLNLYFARKNLELQREQMEFEARKAATLSPVTKEPPIDKPLAVKESEHERA
jgi:hypothetical protein